MDRVYLAGLTMCKRVEPSTLRKLVSALGSAKAVWESDVSVWRSKVRMKENTVTALDMWRRHVQPDLLEKQLQEHGIFMIVRGDIHYPVQLYNLAEPPLALFVKGQLSFETLTDLSISVVGTRRASGYGLEVSKWIGDVLAGSQITLVSGMDLGIDAAAHKSSLDADGKTIAVLGCGVDVCYPQSNFRIYMRIREKGLVISEYPPGTQVAKHHFPERNRLIAALSRAVVVVQAGEKSGALLTVDHALELGRDVYVVPGPITSKHFRGSHKLLSQGAQILLDPSELLRDYGISQHIHAEEPIPVRLRSLYDAVSETSHPAVLANQLQVSIAHVFAGLLELELLGVLVRAEDGTYHRKFR